MKKRPIKQRPSVLMSRELTRAREEPQAPRDLMAESAAWYRSWQESLGDGPRVSQGNPLNPFQADIGDPSRLPCMLLSQSDQVDAVGYDLATRRLYVANGTAVDQFTRDGVYWYRSVTVDVGEGVNGLSVHDGLLVVRTATKTIFWRRDLSKPGENLAGITNDAFVWTTRSDSNPDWSGPVITNTTGMPAEFVVLVVDENMLIYDVTVEPAVPVHVTALTTGSCCAYREGWVIVGESTGGVTISDYVSGATYKFSAGTTPALTGDAIADCAAIVAPLARVENIARSTEDLTTSSWLPTGATVTDVRITEDTSDGEHRIEQATPGVVTGDYVTFTADMRQRVGTRRGVLRIIGANSFVGNNLSATFDLDAGVIESTFGNVVAAGIRRVGDRWRCWVTGQATADGNVNYRVHLGDGGDSVSYQGNGQFQIEATNVQVELSRFPHDYVPNTGDVADVVLYDTFDNDAALAVYTPLNGATLSIVNQHLNIVSNGVLQGGAEQFIDTVIGGTYQVWCTAPEPFSGGARIVSARLFSSSGTVIGQATITQAETVTFTFVAEETTTRIRMQNNFSNIDRDALYDDLIVRRFEDGVGNTQPARQYLNGVDTGLKVPDWIVATDGGVTEVRDSWRAWDITNMDQSPTHIDYLGAGDGVTSYRFRSQAMSNEPLVADRELPGGYDRRYFTDDQPTSDPGAPKLLTGVATEVRGLATMENEFAWGTQGGLTIVRESEDNFFNNGATYITTTYNTGPQIRVLGAWLNDDGNWP